MSQACNFSSCRESIRIDIPDRAPSIHEEVGTWFGHASSVKFLGPNSAIRGIKALPQRYRVSIRYQQFRYRIGMAHHLDLDVILVRHHVA